MPRRAGHPALEMRAESLLSCFWPCSEGPGAKHSLALPAKPAAQRRSGLEALASGKYDGEIGRETQGSAQRGLTSALSMAAQHSTPPPPRDCLSSRFTA